MKTAISVQDQVFRRAEKYARHARKSRSQLYTEALVEYLARHAPDEVTDSMNLALDAIGADREDGFVGSAAHRMLEQVEW